MQGYFAVNHLKKKEMPFYEVLILSIDYEWKNFSCINEILKKNN